MQLFEISGRHVVMQLFEISGGHVVMQLFESLNYQPEGYAFDSSWCQWNCSLP